jgi:stearoyl-CoA desaturase (delta-9 desaturase)
MGMMEPVIRVDGTNANPDIGVVKIHPFKLFWNGTMIGCSFLLAPFYFTFSAFFLFLLTSYITLLIGHSVGMHRMMIHRAFKATKPLERLLIYVGVLVGIGGPSAIIRIHDMRDWAQRQPQCHDFFSHRRNYIRDVTWQLFYKFDFENPPKIKIENNIAKDPWLIFFDKTWVLHQCFLGLILFFIGGTPWVLWGVCVRVAVSTIGHWTVTYICHNPGPGKWEVKGAGVQASNLNFAGFLTHGECWHNNHHAFPESAKIGLETGQADPAWWMIKLLEKLGVVSNVQLPRAEFSREDLIARSGV